MRIYSLSKLLSLPVLLLFLGLIYASFTLRVDIGYFMFLPLVLGVLLYISYENIDFWFLSKYPIKLDKEVTILIERYCPFYNNLSAEDKNKYHKRMSIYMSGRIFKSIGSLEQKNVPDDIKAMITTNVIQMTFDLEDYMLKDFGRIFAYKHAFPSPQYKFLHTVETEAEDGMIVLSIEHAIPGITNPEVYYNIGMHGYIDAFCIANPTAPYPYNLDADWDDVEAISGHSKEFILNTIGFDNADLFIVLATCYFVYSEAFRERLPELTLGMDKIFVA